MKKEKRNERNYDISQRMKNEKGCDLNLILLNLGSDLLDNSDVLLTLE